MTEIPKVLRVLYGKLQQEKSEREDIFEKLLNTPTISQYDDCIKLLENLSITNSSIKLLEDMMSGLQKEKEVING